MIASSLARGEDAPQHIRSRMDLCRGVMLVMYFGDSHIGNPTRSAHQCHSFEPRFENAEIPEYKAPYLCAVH